MFFKYNRTMVNNLIHVIAVDDEEDTELLYTHFFEDEVASGRIKLTFITSPLECFNLLPQIEGNRVVLSDINMPEISGFDLLAKVKSLDEEIKVLMVSAYDQRDYIDRCLALGAEDFLVKPINFIDLKKRILDLF